MRTIMYTNTKNGFLKPEIKFKVMINITLNKTFLGDLKGYN